MTAQIDDVLDWLRTQPAPVGRRMPDQLNLALRTEACPSRLSRPAHRASVASPRSHSDLERALQTADPSGAYPVGGDQRSDIAFTRTVLRSAGGFVRVIPRVIDAAAEQLNAASVDVVCLQHEFGLYGIWGDPFEDHLTAIPG